VVLALAPIPLLVSAAVWVAVLKVWGFVSLASMTGAVTFPLAVWIIGAGNRYVLPMGAAIAAFILFTHRANLRRLRAGTENRFGPKARSAARRSASSAPAAGGPPWPTSSPGMGTRCGSGPASPRW
jgi:glycerol-3-phosphate acyltransferase PlsY